MRNGEFASFNDLALENVKASFNELALCPVNKTREALERRESYVGPGIKAPGDLPFEGKHAASRSDRVTSGAFG